MIGIDTLGESTQAVATVGLILSEAITLHIGYGALTRIAGSTVHEALGGD